MKLILIGYMSAGKSTVGRYLGKLVGEKYYDLDGLIVKSEKNLFLKFLLIRKKIILEKRKKI